LNNPYVVDRPLTHQDLFFGQESVLRQLERALAEGQRLFLLYGPPHSGKTSFLNQLGVRLPDAISPRRVDCADLRVAPEDPLRYLAAALSPALDDGSPEPTEQENDSAPALADGHPEPESRPTPAWRDLLNRPLPADEATTHLVCLDALPASALDGDTAWQRALEALSQQLPMAGRLAVLLAIDGPPPETPVAGWQSLRMTRLNEDDTEDLIMLPSRGKISYAYEAVRRIHHLTGGLPHLVQLFGHSLWETRLQAGWAGLPEVEQVVPQVMALADQHLRAIWGQCSHDAQVVLCAFAERLGGHGLASQRDLTEQLVRGGIQATPAQVERALAELHRRDVLDLLGGPTYRLASELLRQWVAERYHALELARRDRQVARPVRRRPRMLRGVSIDWVSWLLWGVALLLVGLIVYVWRSRETLVFWTTEPTPMPTHSSAAALPSPPPTSERGVIPGNILFMAKASPEDVWSIYTMQADGTDPRRLTQTEANDTSPVCSPDGRRIAFVSDRDGNREVYAMNADGNNQLNLTNNAAEDWTPTWSPDGARIAFASFRDGNWEIYVMGSDGSDPRRLTNNPAADYAPVWSPDGSLLAFVSNRDGNLEIYVMAPDGSEQTRFTFHEATDQTPAWSPDSTQLVWESYRETNMELYASRLDGTDLRNISQDVYADDHGPAWSPWGDRLAFYSNRQGGWDIYTLDMESGERANITLSPALEQAPFWAK
jgi:hypothetical protein